VLSETKCIQHLVPVPRNDVFTRQENGIVGRNKKRSEQFNCKTESEKNRSEFELITWIKSTVIYHCGCFQILIWSASKSDVCNSKRIKKTNNLQVIQILSECFFLRSPRHIFLFNSLRITARRITTFFLRFQGTSFQSAPCFWLKSNCVQFASDYSTSWSLLMSQLVSAPFIK